MDKKTFNNNIKIAFSNIGLQRNNKGEYFFLLFEQLSQLPVAAGTRRLL